MTVKLVLLCAELTVGAGLELETGAAGSIPSSGASSDLQQVGSVGLQAIQSDVATPGTKDGVAGLLLLLQCKRQRKEVNICETVSILF